MSHSMTTLKTSPILLEELTPCRKCGFKIVAVNDRGCRIGQYHHNAKLSDEVIDRIRAMHEDDGIGYRMIAKLLNISRHTIRDICRYERRAQTYEHWKKLTMIVEVHDEAVRVAETV